MTKSRKQALSRSNAERQAAYRQRHSRNVDGQGQRLNMVVTVQAKAQLERLARHYGVTQRELLARVLANAERKVVDGLTRADERSYYRTVA